MNILYNSYFTLLLDSIILLNPRHLFIFIPVLFFAMMTSLYYSELFEFLEIKLEKKIIMRNNIIIYVYIYYTGII